MNIERTKEIGFCYGVKRAVDMLEKAAQNGPVATLGAVVHNRQVLEELAGRGITTVNRLDELPG